MTTGNEMSLTRQKTLGAKATLISHMDGKHGLDGTECGRVTYFGV